MVTEAEVELNILNSSWGQCFELRFFGFESVCRIYHNHPAPFHRGLEWCIENRRPEWRPNHPPPNTLAHSLFYEVHQHLNKDLIGRFCLFPAIGTDLDHRGVDGFFTLDKAGVAKVVTFDLTTYSRKTEFEADILITEMIFDDDVKFERLAKKIAQMFKRPKGVHYLPSLKKID